MRGAFINLRFGKAPLINVAGPRPRRHQPHAGRFRARGAHESAPRAARTAGTSAADFRRRALVVRPGRLPGECAVRRVHRGALLGVDYLANLPGHTTSDEVWHSREAEGEPSLPNGLGGVASSRVVPQHLPLARDEATHQRAPLRNATPPNATGVPSTRARRRPPALDQIGGVWGGAPGRQRKELNAPTYEPAESPQPERQAPHPQENPPEPSTTHEQEPR
ncbi:hypothetical protein LX88_000345 [Lentzea californiensis]|nr:hypothetical protein [Lentzea californiensis]